MYASAENDNALFESINLNRDALVQEIGEAATPLLEEAHDRLGRAKPPPRARKIFLVVLLSRGDYFRARANLRDSQTLADRREFGGRSMPLQLINTRVERRVCPERCQFLEQ